MKTFSYNGYSRFRDPNPLRLASGSDTSFKILDTPEYITRQPTVILN